MGSSEEDRPLLSWVSGGQSQKVASQLWGMHTSHHSSRAGGRVGMEVRVMVAMPLWVDMYIQATQREPNKLKVFVSAETQRKGQHPPLPSISLPFGPKHQGLE